MIRALVLLLLFAPMASAQSFWVSRPPSYEAKKPKPPPNNDGIVWSHVGTTQGVTSNYTPVVIIGGSQIRVFSNTNGTTDGNLYLRVGSWSSVGSAAMAYDTPAGSDNYIRTLGITRGRSGKYYALMYVGPCYGCTQGFSPAFATSDDGMQWTYYGRVSPFGANQSSGMNLIVDESRTDAYACMAWMDIGANLYLIHAPMPCDTGQWASDGLPTNADGQGTQFCGAAKTPYGYHRICANTYPATALIHDFSCDGLTSWRVIETASDIINTTTRKGANLTFDPATGLLHALVSGEHWVWTATALAC